MRFEFPGRGGGPPFTTNGGPTIPPATGKVLKWATVPVGLIFLFVLLSVVRAVYTDWLWFDHLGFLSVYTRILTARIWLFFSGAALMGVLTGITMALAYRLSRGPVQLPIPQEAFVWLRRLTISGIVVTGAVISIIFGSVASGRWETLLLFMNSVSFDRLDPVYGNDVSFYAFTVPVLHLVQGWLLGAAIVLLVASVGVYFAHFSLRGVNFALTWPMRIHLAVLGALLMFVIGWGHFLDTYELLFSPSGAVTGATYADVNARRPALLLVTAVAGLSGVLMLGSIYLRNLMQAARLVGGAFGLWVIAAILVGALYPALIQRFVVDPSELTRERPFIERNIEWTRDGFGLDRIVSQGYPVREEVSREVLLGNPQTINNIRLWDYRPLRDVYNQIQHLRLYYDFLDVDVDRYTIDGEYKQVLLAPRELAPEKLPQEAQRWVNRKLQYTHGYGVVMSSATEFTPEGQPEFFIKDVPPQGDVPVKLPQIYYGEGTLGFVIVNSKTEEFDHPATQEEENPTYASYQGLGGVPLSSLIRRMAYTWQFTDINILISGQITSESRIQYQRTIQERIGAVAPFLRLDQDPYIVVAEGKVFWIQDAYTVTDRFPYSRLLNGDFSYVRNSVKVVADAYNGTLRFFVFEPDDPLVRTYARIFPDLFEPMDAMPEALRDHTRYPEDLFSWQAETYLQYHMTDPTVFFNKEDQWSIPSEVVFAKPQQVRPYYVIMKLPGEEREEFVLILPFTPANKPNLVAWLAARNDSPHYGELTSFSFPKVRQIDGPSQVEARIDNDPLISEQFTLWGQSGSFVIRGNLLVIPVGGTLLYAEPVYLQAESLNFPELKRVILVTKDKVVMTPTLRQSVFALLGEAPPAVVRPPPTVEQPPAGSGGISPEELQSQIQGIMDSIRAFQDGLAQLQEALKRLEDLAKRGQP